jgi:hypothetical protein
MKFSFSLCEGKFVCMSNQLRAMMAYSIASLFLTSSLDEVVRFKPRPLYHPGERASSIHSTGGWVVSTAGLDAVEKEEILTPAENRIPAVLRVARRYSVHSELS